uniref:Rieske domain-containing protein n=1 Tax=Fundulus heteroclitus TaxID=8078 RepID=A0A3Q2UAS8_FUNHE
MDRYSARFTADAAPIRLSISLSIFPSFVIKTPRYLISSTMGKMTAQTSKLVLSLDAKDVDSLKDGVNFRKNPDDGKCYIIYKSSDGFKACKNQCKHQGGVFIKDIEDLDGR